MSTESSTAVLEQRDSTPTEESFVNDAVERFRQMTAPQETPVETTPATPPPAVDKPKADDTKPTDGIPDEFLSGKPAEKPAEDPDAAILDSQPTGQVKHEHFAKVQTVAKQRIAAAQAEAEKLAARLKELEGKSGPDEKTKAELESWQKKAQEAEERLERANFERSPKFQGMVKKETAALESAKSYLEGTEVNASVIDMASRVTGVARLKVLREAGADAETIAAVTPYLAQFDAIQSEKNSALENHKATAEQWQLEEKARRDAEESRTRQQEERLFIDVGSQIAKEFEPFQEVPGNEAWNAEVRANRERAKQFFDGDMPLKDVMEIAYYGVGAKKVHQMFRTVREQLNEARKELAALKSAQPGAGAGRGPGNLSENDLTPEQRFARNLAASQQARGY